MSDGLKRHNHYVPEFYLHNWATKHKLKEYLLLVSNDNVPLWNDRSVEYASVQDNLYVRSASSEESDDFENYFNTEFETPAKLPFEKAVSGERLTPDDWYKLVSLTAAQAVRTPAYYLKMKDNLKDAMPGIIESVGKELKELPPEKLKDHREPEYPDKDLLPLQLNWSDEPEEDGSRKVEIETVVGKSMWLFDIRHIMDYTSKILHQQKWSIISSSEGVLWPTSDDPVICLNYYNEKNYNFAGGWGIPGSEIIFPISPTKALYTQVGHKNQPRITLPEDASLFIKKIIVEHALLYVYSVNEDPDIPKIRKRTVNNEEFIRVRDEFKNWYSHYNDLEVPYLYNK